MASLWAKTLPRVTVPLGTQPKTVTLVYPYYESPQFLQQQQQHWLLLREELNGPGFDVIVVDDGSPHEPAIPAIASGLHAFPYRLFRIGVDVPWNWLAARNIGAHHATTDWLVLTDMDHLVPFATMRAILYGQHHPKVVYAFARREHTGVDIEPHSASFLMTRTLFWRIGGYDERLSGHYGTDGEFRRRLMKVAPIHVLPERLIRYEYVADASTQRYTRKLPADAVAVKQLVNARGKAWRPKVLSFPYQEVAPC
jgi:glycosyltransferase involved in cell wall biosynthesis